MNNYTIIIPVYNGLVYTRMCLNSIYQCSNENETNNFEVIVIDNMTTDGTIALLKEFANRFDNFHFLSRHRNTSFALSCNKGVQLASSEYLIFLTHESEVTSDWSERLLIPLKTDEQIWAIAPRCISPCGKISHAGITLDRLHIPRYIYKGFPADFPPATLSRYYQCLSGPCVAMRRSDFLKIKGFDPTILNKQDIIDICIRINRLGKRVYYAADSLIIQHASIIIGQNNSFVPSTRPYQLSWPRSIITDDIIAMTNNFNTVCVQNKLNIIKNYLSHNELKDLVSIQKESSSVHCTQEGLLLKGTCKILEIPLDNFSAQLASDFIVLSANIHHSAAFTVKLYYQTHSEPWFSETKAKEFFSNNGEFFLHAVLPARHTIGLLRLYFGTYTGDFLINGLWIHSYISTKLSIHREPILSVVIPCYNHGVFLHDAIRSVEQMKNNVSYEVIIVDDGSDESETLEILTNYESIGYRVIRQVNRGLGAARNTGISHARGEYILPLDSDNMICARFVARAIEILDIESDAGVVYGDVKFFGERMERIDVPPFYLLEHFVQNKIDACAIYRKLIWQQVGGYDENMLGYQDWEFWTSVAALERWKFVHFGDIAFYYRVRSDSMVSNTKRYHEQLKDYICKKNIRTFRREYEKLYYDYQALVTHERSVSTAHKTTRRRFKLLGMLEYFKFAKQVKAAIKNSDYLLDFPIIVRLAARAYLFIIRFFR